MDNDAGLNVKPIFKKTSIFKWLIIWGGGLFAKLKFNVKYDKKQIKAFRKIKGPVFVLSNHQSPMDFVLTTFAVYPKRVSTVVGVGVFYDKRVGKMTRMLKNNIPKKQFSTDYECIKNIKKMIDAGVSVLIYPEGRFTLSGYTGKIMDNTIAKLAKWLNVPVVVVRNNGAFLTRTRFLNGFKRGKIFTEVNIAATKDEIKDIDINELNSRIRGFIDYNDLEYQEKNHIAFKCKKFNTTDGYEPLIYKCPKCNVEYQMVAEGDSFKCNACGYIADMDEYGAIAARNGDISLKRYDKWYDFQYDALKEEIAKDENYTLGSDVVLKKIDTKLCDFIEIDKGYFCVSKEGFSFKGQNTQLFMQLPNPPVIAIPNAFAIEMFDALGNLYLFNLLGKESSIKFSMATEILFGLYCQNRRKK